MDALTKNMARIAVDSGDPELCLETGRRLFYGHGNDVDWMSARRCLEPLDDNAEALMMLAQIYQLGIGVKTDNAKIFALYKRSADLGNAEAMFRLGKMYMSGTYIRKNEAKAYHLINESKIRGFVPNDEK